MSFSMKRQTPLEAEQIRNFQAKVYDYYRAHARRLTWRETNDPYKILISEIMLQQTQVARVIEKYEQFVRTFPDVESLERAPLRDVLGVWQGLGYNRRALALKRLAKTAVAEHEGKIPSSIDSLMALPGIGRTTAHAICAFAFNQPTVFIETNIRTVFIHHFFRKRSNVNDTEILPLVAQTVDSQNPRTWYYALMDYGAALKKTHTNPSRNSAHYQKQGPFQGSNRQIRGVILQTLLKKSRVSQVFLMRATTFPEESVRQNLKQLEKEGLIVKKGRYISIA
ncbi:MAG: A/G-specific adenine glycosylase [Pseudomonadota bacterium]